MQLPLSTIKSFIHIDLSVEKVAETLTLLGLEVDAVHSPKPPFSRVVVAEIKSVERHPAADKLQVAQVFDGVSTLQVVCGASNCRPNLRVAFAQIGALLTDRKGEQRSIEKTSIRGVESMGMLCSPEELGLYEDHSGIIELPNEFPIGADCTEFLWDPVFEISLTPNLGHCMSALGVARELSAALQKPLHSTPVKIEETGNRKINEAVEISVRDGNLCPRYTARLIEEIRIAPSPFWLQRELHAAGIRPINNVVDATNYMRLKYGQPMHAFDLNRIEGKTIEIAATEAPHSFEGLDGQTWEVPVGSLAIFDGKKMIALAGMLGGANSSVTDSTHTILLEAAAFDPAIIRSASKKMGLRTDSSYRFEKGIDPASTAKFLDEAAALIAQISHGKVAKGMIDLKQKTLSRRPIECRVSRVNALLGTNLSEGEIESIFHRLGFTVRKESSRFFSVETPLYRNDLHEEIDLIEEAARIYGYNNIERPIPKATTPQIPHDPTYLFETELRRRLVSFGLQEFITCDLISPKLASIAQDLSISQSMLIQTLHSKSEEYSILRPSLLPGLLQSVQQNLAQKTDSFSAFEMGRIHFLQEGKVVELSMAALLLIGNNSPPRWDRKPAASDFFDLKGLVENLFAALRVAPYAFVPSQRSAFHPGRQADVFLNSLFIGTIGELHPDLLAKFDIKERVYYAELNAHQIQHHQGPAPRMTPLPQFPASERDWTLPLLPNTPISLLFTAIRSLSIPLLAHFELIDLYRTEEKTNATLRFTYRDRSKTLSFEEVESAHAQLTTEITKALSL